MIERADHVVCLAGRRAATVSGQAPPVSATPVY